MSGTDNMKKWNDLSMAERAKYIKLVVQSGITNLSNIRNIYNSFAEGGHINKYDGTTEPSQQMNMRKPEILKQIDWEQTYNPNSPYYINPENRRNHRQYSRTGEPIIPFSWYKTWAHPETGQLVSLKEARNYGHNVIDPETGEETLELLNPMLDELTVPSWKEAVKYVKRPTGGGALGTFEVKYKRANNERFSANPYDYNPKDDLGPIDAVQDNEQYLKYLDEHPVDDPADNFLNQLPFDLLTLGTSSAAKQGLKLGWNAFNKLGQKTVSGLSKLTPSNLMKGVASYAPKSWTPTLNTLGYLGDAGMFAYGVNIGINSIRYGIENNDPWQTTAGGLETALSVLPVFEYSPTINKLYGKAKNFVKSYSTESVKNYTDRASRLIQKSVSPEYLEPLRFKYSTPYSKEEAENIVKRALIKSRINHEQQLSLLGEGTFTYNPDTGTYMNEDQFVRWYRVLNSKEKGLYTNPIELSKEEGKIREIFPEYYIYARENGLPVDNEETFTKFLDRMSTSTRGITMKDPNNVEEYLTIAGNKPLNKPGGDRLNTNSGLYTSNSEEIADRFSRNISGVSDNKFGVTAKLYHQFDIDYNLPISKRLQQLRDQIHDVTVFDKVPGINIGRNKLSLLASNYNKDFEIHAVESPYMSRISKERAYIGHNEKDKVVTIKGEPTIRTDVSDRKHRWSPGKVRDEEGLFIPSYASYSNENIDKYTERLIKTHPNWNNTFKEDIKKRINRLDYLYRRNLALKRIIPFTAAVSAGLIGGAVAVHNYNNNKIIEEERNKIEAIKNKGYAEEDIQVLRKDFGMENASRDEVIEAAEEYYKELISE